MSTRPGRHLTLVASNGAPVTGVVDPSPAQPPRLPSYVPTLGLVANARGLARPLWGTARAEWTQCLAEEVATCFPEARRGRQTRGWVAGILLAAARDLGMQGGPQWACVRADIAAMTGASLRTAERRFAMLDRVGLTTPARPPGYWHRC